MLRFVRTMQVSNDRTDCCPPGTLPSLVPADLYQQRGAVLELGDLPVYVVGPSTNLTAVIVSYDIYGFNGGRIRNICDEFAAEGHLVILPDYFRGDCWTAEREACEMDSKKDWITRLGLGLTILVLHLI